MGNISSIIGRGGGADEQIHDHEHEDNRRRREVLRGEDFISDGVAGLELNHHDYQMTLHQYLSQRYAERYTNTTYEYTQQRLRTHETQSANSAQGGQNQTKEPLSRNSSFNQSGDLIVLSLKGKKLKEVPLELFYHDEVTSLDLSNNGKQRTAFWVSRSK